MRLRWMLVAATVSLLTLWCGFASPELLGEDTTATKQPIPMGNADRRALARRHGGTAASEAAVDRALHWIASRQCADGGWNFDHNQSKIDAPCPDPGTADKARNAATALALLPLLAAGQTHKKGDYRKEVGAGLDYLIKNLKVADRRGSWHEPQGSMYSHGYATLAICDAYARTFDDKLQRPAQRAVNFIAFAQDPVGGGWRYALRQAGDTSASVVQIMALKRAHKSMLDVPKATIMGAVKFLDGVQADGGAKYGYTQPGAGNSTTAMGLLCRVHLGWKRDNAALQRGIKHLDKLGPSDSNMYFNYYAHQVMFHYGGAPWRAWNKKLRTLLVETQSKQMDASLGSWFFKAGDHGAARAGRLYCTALAALILETYYREPRVYR